MSPSSMRAMRGAAIAGIAASVGVPWLAAHAREHAVRSNAADGMAVAPTAFLPHGICFLWDPALLLLQIVSDALIVLAYYSIPILLVYFVRKRRDVPFSGVFWMFGLFIIACGTTHLMDIWTIWHPAYWLAGSIKAVTAGASLATAALLLPLIPKALALPSPAELDKLNRQLAVSLSEKDEMLRKYEREHHVATTLQHASLAPGLPEVPGLHLSAVYVPGASEADVGGDWYDAFQVPDGRLFVSLGDVAGTGLDAAVIMGKVRQAIRVASQIQLDPAAILNAVDRSLQAEYPNRVVTAFVGLIDQIEQTLTYASAGHPPPLLRAADGTVSEAASAAALPLGLRTRTEPASQIIPLPVGTLLVLYSDGLVEATRDLAEGERRLRAVLGSDAIARAERPAQVMHDAVLGGTVTDDVAILTVRITATLADLDRRSDGAVRLWRWAFDAHDRDAARTARLACIDLLEAAGASGEEAYAAELVFGELVGNVVRHAPGLVDVALEWAVGRAPVLHVLDRGPGFQHIARLPSDLYSESGRGLFLIASLTEEFHITRRSGMGSHARAVLLLAATSERSAWRPATTPSVVGSGTDHTDVCER